VIIALLARSGSAGAGVVPNSGCRTRSARISSATDRRSAIILLIRAATSAAVGVLSGESFNFMGGEAQPLGSQSSSHGWGISAPPVLWMVGEDRHGWAVARTMSGRSLPLK
jgi:hypothetical protein